MKDCLQQRKPFAWEKIGLVFAPNIPSFTHGSHPCAIHVKDDLFVVAFTCRDPQQRSHIFLSYATVCAGNMSLIGQPKMALSPGANGYFDADGVISVSFVSHNNQTYLYYVGWQNLPDKLWICDTGRATLNMDDLTLTKEFMAQCSGVIKITLYLQPLPHFISKMIFGIPGITLGLNGKKGRRVGATIMAFIMRNQQWRGLGL